MAWRRPIRQLLFWGLTGSLIGLAVLLALIQLALPWWASNPERVAGLLSSRLGSPVEIEATRPYWSATGPIIELQGVRFGIEGSSDVVNIERAAWAVDFSGLVRGSRALTEFRIHGLDLTVVRDPDGRWQVLGLPELMTDDDRPLAQTLRALPAIALRESRLVLRESPRRPDRIFQLHELRRIAGNRGMHWRGRVGVEDAGTDTRAGELQLALDLTDSGRHRLYVSGRDLELSGWLAEVPALAARPSSGRLDLDLWLDFDHNGIDDVQLHWQQYPSSWQPLSVGSDPVELDAVSVPELEAVVRWRRDADGHRVLIEPLRLGSSGAARVEGRMDQGQGGWLRIAGVDLDAFASLLALSGRLPDPVREWLDQAQPAGELAALDIFFDADARPVRIAADLRDLASRPTPGSPGISAFDVRLRADRDGVVLWPGQDPFVFEYPGVLAAPVSARVAAGSISAWTSDHDDGAWHLAADQLDLVGDGFHVIAEGGVRWHPEQPLFFDLGAQVYDSEIEAVKAFWPLNKIPNSARWLNRALLGGRIVRGDFWVRGAAGAFPFVDNDGRLDAIAEVEQAGLHFHDDWPELHDIVAQVGFVNRSMRIAAERVRFAGIAVAGSRADVDDLTEPWLRIRGRARASGEQLLALVEASPMQEWFGSHLQGMQVDGQPRVHVDLNLPLKQELGETRIDGRIEFAGERYTHAQWNLDFSDLQGSLRFDRGGVSVSDLDLRLAGEQARMELRIGSHTRIPDRVLEARLNGWLSADAVFGGVEAVAPMLRHARGRANWQVETEVPDEGAGRIVLESDLRGIALALPAPLTKRAESVLPLQLTLGIEAGAQPIDLRLGQVLQMQAQLPTSAQAFAGSVALGGASTEPLPAQGLIISGQVPALDLSGWLALGGSGVESAAGTTAAWPRVLLRAGELGVFGRAFQEVDLQVRPGADGVGIELRGPQIEGRVDWPLQRTEPVRGRFVRLHVPDGDGQVLGENLAPTAMPDLDIEADALRVGASRLGSARLLARVVDDRYRIETFATRSPAFELDASGDWRRDTDGDRSTLSVDLRADDLGAMLESFGFAGLVQGGRTQARIEGHWAGSPAAFALERIDGRLDLDVAAGRIIDVDPGVGRLFGLLNLREIPRRLILDFRDFFSQGLRFNSIVGSFRLDVGDAWTEDLLLRSSAADIRISGRTGLTARDYEQTVEVTPRMGGTLPVVGAIAGGPAGAAAGLVMQNLFRIDEASRAVYLVTGAWDDPEIVRQDAEPESPRRRTGSRNR